MRVAINLSVHQLRQPDLVDRIASRRSSATDVNPGC
jgi:EAL domain-containing protein (putative c-di-GMP-specific phosphodiesterase class I)